MDTLYRTGLSTIRKELFWLPHWLAGVIILLLVAGAALAVHATFLRLVRRAPLRLSQFWHHLILRAVRPTRLLILVVAVGSAVPASGFSHAWKQGLLTALSAAFVLLLGWGAVIAIALAGDLYLARLKGDYTSAMKRKHLTQVRVLRRAAQVLIVVIAVGSAMMIIPDIRQYGVSIFASAGAAGIVVGLAARPLLSNLLAGIQIAFTQPVKIEDSVVINNEWGWIEDITSTYLVLRTWDLRRLIIPLSWFLEQPVQNWTRESATIIGQVHLNVDYRTPIDDLRRELNRIIHESRLWDQGVVNLQVVEADAETIQIRILATASDAGRAWDLRCELREKMIAFISGRYPQYLPQRRILVDRNGSRSMSEEINPVPLRRSQSAARPEAS